MIKELYEQLTAHNFPGELIYASLSGSHLYGTATPTSDVDVRGVFQANTEDIILNRAKKTYSFDLMLDGERVDNEFTEFRKFIHDAMGGQTYALDILHSNIDSKIYLDHMLGRLLFINKGKLLSKNMSAIVHYCINQAKKYTEKGKRFKTYKQLQIFLKPFRMDTKLSEIDFTEAPAEIIKKVNKGTGVEEEFLEIGNKLFPMNTKVIQLRKSLNSTIEDYGNRAKSAAADGKDYKALSHAYRLVDELEELWTTGSITFPLKNREFITQVKQGKYECDNFGEELTARIDNILAQPSALPEEADKEYWEKIIRLAYLNPQALHAEFTCTAPDFLV